MSYTTRSPIRRVLAALLCLAAAGTGLVCGQSNVGPNEQRFNAGSYKASHNSYDRGESLASQVDNWNCWCLELDLHWHSSGTIQVHHLCELGGGGPSVLTELLNVRQSVEQADRVTVVYLELKGACSGSWPARNTYRTIIKDAALAAFGNAVYPALEFKTNDRFRWPSYQNLLQRGFRWVIILDEQETGFADDDFFFGMARGNPPTAFEANSVLVNSGLGGVIPDRGAQPDRWLFRAYPGPYCDLADDEEYFDAAIARGYNFVATNCMDHHYTMTPTTHSASPLHVASQGSGTAFGTLAFPYRAGAGLVQAVARASPRVPIKVEPGLYHVAAGTRLSGSCVLRAEGGLVGIVAP